MKKKLYLVQPLEHGNGGWYGSKTLAHVTFKCPECGVKTDIKDCPVDVKRKEK